MLATLDGSREAAVALLSGLSPEQIEELGGPVSTPPRRGSAAHTGDLS